MNMGEAIQAMEADQFVLDTLGEEFSKCYLKAKKNYIKQKVKEMENELPTKVRDALLAW